MSFFGKKKQVEAVLFSPLEGRLTLNGQPASGAKITLWLAWKDKEGEAYNYTADDSGFFKIPKQTAMYTPDPLAQLVISQEINVEYGGESYEVWVMSKMEPEEFTELAGKAVNLVCELANDLTTVRGNRSLGGTVCTWDSLDS